MIDAVFFSFPHHKFAALTPFHAIFSEENHYAQPTFKKGGSCVLPS